MSVREGLVEVPQGQLFFEDRGAGPVVILMHAGVADHTMWDRQVEVFAEGHRVVRYDALGFGRSTAPGADHTPHDDLGRLLDYLGVDRAALVGVSMSGGIAIDFALAYPKRLWALIPVAAGLDGYDWSTDESLRKFGEEERAALDEGDVEAAVELNVRLWVDGPARQPDVVDPWVREKVRQMQRAIFERGEPPGQPLPLEPSAITRLEEIRAPTLAIVGDQDVPAIREITDLIAMRVPGARKHVIANVAHLPNMERPGEFNRIVLEFLHSVEA